MLCISVLTDINYHFYLFKLNVFITFIFFLEQRDKVFRSVLTSAALYSAAVSKRLNSELASFFLFVHARKDAPAVDRVSLWRDVLSG